MGKFLDEIPGYLGEWILKQQMFWVASAPLSSDGHVNISPKGIEGTFHIENSRRVWYEDLSGTGAETVAHIRENGRVTILFNAFEGTARIVRLYGKGFFYEIGTPEYDSLIGQSRRLTGSRAIIGVDIKKVGTTCGYAVPYYQFLGHRKQLMNWAAKKEADDQEFDEANRQQFTQSHHSDLLNTMIDGKASISPNGMKQWWLLHNLVSLDGLPAFSSYLGENISFLSALSNARNKKPAQITSTSTTKYSSHLSLSSRPSANLIVNAVSPDTGGGDDMKHSSLSLFRQKLSGIPQQSHDVLFVVLAFLVVFALGICVGRLSQTHHVNCSPYAF